LQALRATHGIQGPQATMRRGEAPLFLLLPCPAAHLVSPRWSCSTKARC